MILKPPLAEAQIALGKQKNTFCGTRVSVSLPKFCVKLLPRAKFHWNHAVGCWVMAKIRFSIRRVSAISRIFKNVIFGHVTVIDFQMCCCVSNFIEIGMIFLLRSGDLTTCNMAAVRRVEISKYSVYVTWRLSPCYSASLCKISLKSDNWLMSYGQKRLWKWRASSSWIKKKLNLITWLSSSSKFAFVYQIAS